MTAVTARPLAGAHRHDGGADGAGAALPGRRPHGARRQHRRHGPGGRAVRIRGGCAGGPVDPDAARARHRRCGRRLRGDPGRRGADRTVARAVGPLSHPADRPAHARRARGHRAARGGAHGCRAGHGAALAP